MAYDVLLLDFDHTLFDSDRSEELAFAATMRLAGVEDPTTVFPTYQAINGALWAQVESGTITPPEIRTVRFERLVATLGLDAAPIELADAFIEGMAAFGELFPGAADVLGTLAARARLALVTNGLTEVVRPRLARLGIGDLFDAVVISAEVGSSKPARPIFDATFTALGEPDRTSALMVGDSLSSDIRGGHDYGIATCWFNRHGVAASADHHARVTHEITDLADLVALIG